MRFPYDERLRQLLRALPGRRWDPIERVWRLPLDPERAEALALLFAGLPGEPDVGDALARALARLRARRRRGECHIDLARPDESWWLTFAADCARLAAEVLLEHPGAYTLPAIGRVLLPLDDLAVQLVEQLDGCDEEVRLSEAAHRALGERRARATGDGAADTRERAPREPERRYEIEFRRDRRGEHWILVAPEHARLARALAEVAGLRALEGPGGTLGLAAVDYDAAALRELIAGLPGARVEPRVASWLVRMSTWRGTIEVASSGGEPALLLLGEVARLPQALRERAASAPGGARVPLTLDSWELIDGQLEGWISHAARRCVEALRAGRPAPPAVLELSSVHEQPTFVLAPGHDTGAVEAFRALAGVQSRPPRRGEEREHAHLPAIRADPFCVPELDRFLTASGAWVDPDALGPLQEIREQHARAAGLVALSAATDAPLAPLRLGGELKPFQRAGVSYLLAQRRAFLADEQGLGKTIEALATLEAADAYPAIVVCPASLKLNWQRELERWLAHRSVRVLVGNGAGGPLAPGPACRAAPGEADAEADAETDTDTDADTDAEADGDADAHAVATGRADVTIANYDILAARAAELCALGPRALVLDESHYCKNAAAKRTQAVQRVSAAVPRDGLVLALTGTPVVNRPAELISQLRILGRLADFGSGVQFGERFRGADAHLRLHWHLRARCFVRRLKPDVLPQLPAKTRAVVPVELDNEPEYRLAERDVVAWLQSQPLDLRELDAKVAAALRAERLVRLNALKLLAARGKLRAALAWIHDFCSSGERLVVFAHHREIQQALLERFPGALHILGGDSHGARDDALRRFQAPDEAANQLIVCSIEVAGHGLTLTRASNVVFLELDWTPAKHDQAEDRCHRIGQQDAVNVSYLLAAGTIDETIATLLERKRAVIGAVTDGRQEDEEGVLDALVRELRGAPYRHLRAVA